MMKFGGIVVSSVMGFMSIACLYGMKTTSGADDYDDVVVIQMQQLSLDSHINQEKLSLDLSDKPLSLAELKQASSFLIKTICDNNIEHLKIAPSLTKEAENKAVSIWLAFVFHIAFECRASLKKITVVTNEEQNKSWLGSLLSSAFAKFSTLFKQVQDDDTDVEAQKLKEQFQNAQIIKIDGNPHLLIPIEKTEVQTQTSIKKTVISSVITGVISIGLTIGGQFLVEYIKSL